MLPRCHLHKQTEATQRMLNFKCEDFRKRKWNKSKALTRQLGWIQTRSINNLSVRESAASISTQTISWLEEEPDRKSINPLCQLSLWHPQCVWDWLSAPACIMHSYKQATHATCGSWRSNRFVVLLKFCEGEKKKPVFTSLPDSLTAGKGASCRCYLLPISASILTFKRKVKTCQAFI